MTTIQTPTISSVSAGQSAQPTVELGTATALASDYETFLKMLTTQAKYQDPLEPMDSSEYASQLAQFSVVEQQVRTNELLEAMVGQYSANDMSKYANWIGLEARTAAPLAFDGTPITINPNPAAVSTSVQMVTYNSEGIEVQRETIPVSADPVVWAGVNDNGTPFEEGYYSFGIESYFNGELILNEPIESYTRIVEARTENGQTLLFLQGGGAVLASEISALRDPS
ncbi:MAG: flagellar hook capping FlgD N-terminal domain-containing protein [Aliishimia sp.]